MREIKYRGQRVLDGEWVYGYLVGSSVIVGEIVELNDEYFNTEFWYKVDPKTVGQYTALRDKNGTEIYEGDILKDCLDGYLWMVKFDAGSFELVGAGETVLFDEFEPSTDLEIVGNIYEHHHLLEAVGVIDC